MKNKKPFNPMPFFLMVINEINAQRRALVLAGASKRDIERFENAAFERRFEIERRNQ